MKRLLILIAAVCQLTACAPTTEYVKPDVAIPSQWSPEYPWRESRPSDGMAKGPWWEAFQDAELNRLEQLALAQSPSLLIAAAHLEQAKAMVTVETAGFYPQLGLAAGAARTKTSENRPIAGTTAPRLSTTQNDFTLGLAVRYEADFSGRVRSSVQGAEASAQQAQADYENVRLLLAAELAADYFSLREIDAEIEVVRQSIEFQRKALEFVSIRHALGVATGLDLAQQQAQLDETMTQLDILQNQRPQFEHAVATLTGTPAPDFKIASRALTGTPPQIPLALPSDVLERRPDVASSERSMAVANAQIGVARAAFYPSVILSPVAGLESSTLSTLVQASSLFWALGITATQTLFDAGRNRANLDIAQSGYKATVASYRQTVLTAMQEVEDGLSGSVILARSATNADTAVRSSQQVVDLARARYEGGISTYLDVINAQQGLLSNQRLAVKISGQQFQVAVFLAKAVGGSWQQSK